ncbi:MAG: 3-dehydroquinate synthase [Leptospirillum sp.]
MTSCLVRSRLGDYPVLIESGLSEDLPSLLAGMGWSGRLALVTNPVVHELHGERIVRSLSSSGYRPETLLLPDGEAHKVLSSVTALLDGLLSLRWERGEPLLVLGGGVTGDMGGFAASLLLRGVPLVHIPSTVVAQVDSSIGGKTGVDHPMGKNLLGSFYPPRAVWIDPDLLVTLPLRERRAGLGEVIKYAMIGNAALSDLLDSGIEALGGEPFRRELWSLAISESVSEKARIVSEDEHEGGLRMTLNFGHTFGHALEGALGFGEILHGEAVGLGMLAASRVSERLGLSSGVSERLLALLKASGLPYQWPRDVSIDDLLRFWGSDKKTRGGKATLILPVSWGKVIMTRDYDQETVRKALLDL